MSHEKYQVNRESKLRHALEIGVVSRADFPARREMAMCVEHLRSDFRDPVERIAHLQISNCISHWLLKVDSIEEVKKDIKNYAVILELGLSEQDLHKIRSNQKTLLSLEELNQSLERITFENLYNTTVQADDLTRLTRYMYGSDGRRNIEKLVHVMHIREVDNYEEAIAVYNEDFQRDLPFIQTFPYVVARSGRVDLFRNVLGEIGDVVGYRDDDKTSLQAFIEANKHYCLNKDGEQEVNGRNADNIAKWIIQGLIMDEGNYYGRNPEEQEQCNAIIRELGYNPHLSEVLIERNTQQRSAYYHDVSVEPQCCVVS